MACGSVSRHSVWALIGGRRLGSCCFHLKFAFLIIRKKWSETFFFSFFRQTTPSLWGFDWYWLLVRPKGTKHWLWCKPPTPTHSHFLLCVDSYELNKMFYASEAFLPSWEKTRPTPFLWQTGRKTWGRRGWAQTATMLVSERCGLTPTSKSISFSSCLTASSGKILPPTCHWCTSSRNMKLDEVHVMTN